MFQEDVYQSIQKDLARYPKAKLIAVSKKKPLADILKAHQKGLEHFGENYVQELIAKQEELSSRHGPPLKWHFIGHLQSNKAKEIVGKVDLIHSVDRLSLAEEISKQAQKKAIEQAILLQINISGESSKSGCSPQELENLVQKVINLKGIQLKGLMTIGSPSESIITRELEFEKMNQLLESLNQNFFSSHPLTELSMGMTDDYKLALEKGATLIRVGRALFGERD